MNIKGEISILINRESTTIEIRDKEACTIFAQITLTPDQLSSALSRLSQTPCEIKVGGLEKIGKVHENGTLEFEIPENIASKKNDDDLHKVATSLLKDGWVADKYFSSQRTFFTKDGKPHARCTIRRWVDKTY